MSLLNVVAFAFLFLQAAETDEAIEAERIKEALRITTEWAAKYHFQTASEAPIVLQPDPILRWSNPEQGSIHGNVFLWTHQMRPVVIGSLFQWFSPFTHMSHEFHSLSEQRLTAERSGRIVWESPPGITFQLVAGAPTVAKTANGRQLQMRQIVRAFRVRKRDRDTTEDDELRLLPTPVYRYDESQNAAGSGGLFVFVQATDPELIAWLEARETADNRRLWHVSFARMNSVQIRVLNDSAEIWQADEMPWSEVFAHRQPYTSFTSRHHPIE
ncbi:MAG: hypothetical protein R3C59_10220 [Planctomycetaceae bacterium]